MSFYKEISFTMNTFELFVTKNLSIQNEGTPLNQDGGDCGFVQNITLNFE